MLHRYEFVENYIRNNIRLYNGTAIEEAMKIEPDLVDVIGDDFMLPYIGLFILVCIVSLISHPVLLVILLVAYFAIPLVAIVMFWKHLKKRVFSAVCRKN